MVKRLERSQDEKKRFITYLYLTIPVPTVDREVLNSQLVLVPIPVHLGAGGRGAGPRRLNVSPLDEWREGAFPHRDGSASLISMERL